MQKKMSKGFYIGGYLTGALLCAILFAVAFVMIAASEHTDSPPLTPFGVVAIALLPFVCSIVVKYMFIYRMWTAIQDGQARTSPGAAVGFMFVPLFHLYWMLQVYQGFAQDYNKYIAQRRLSVPRLDEQMFLHYPIVILCSIIPLLGIPLLLVRGY